MGLPVALPQEQPSASHVARHLWTAGDALPGRSSLPWARKGQGPNDQPRQKSNSPTPTGRGCRWGRHRAPGASPRQRGAGPAPRHHPGPRAAVARGTGGASAGACDAPTCALLREQRGGASGVSCCSPRDPEPTSGCTAPRRGNRDPDRCSNPRFSAASVRATPASTH